MTENSSNHLPTVCQLLFSMEVGGAEVLAKEIAEAGAGDFRFVFACLDSAGPLGEQLRESGTIVEVLDRQPGIDFRCARRLARFCREQDVRLIHAHHIGPFRHAGLARFFGGRCPILITEHGRRYPDERSWKRVLMNRLLLRATDRMVAVGHCLMDALTVNEGIPADRIEVIFNGRDLSRYRNDQSTRAETRAWLGLRNEHFVVMQVARLSVEKDHATSIRAISRLRSEHPLVRLVLVGDGPERSAIEQLVTQMGLQGHVTLLGNRSDVERLLPAADVCVLTSITEAIPLTLIEAMATSLPCIGSRVGGVPEVISEDETGLLAEPRNDEAFAESIARLISDPDRCASMGRLARQRAEALFNLNHMREAYFHRYRSMMNLSQPADVEPLQIAECNSAGESLVG